MATYIDEWKEWLIQVTVKKEWGKWNTCLVIEYQKDKTKSILENEFFSELIKKFDSIYNNFDEINALDNSPIKNNLKWKNWEIHSNFLLFCDYLINKIKNSEKNSEIKKIPKIIANLSSYIWRSENRDEIKDKKNSVMRLYKNKIWDKKPQFSFKK